MPAIGFGTANNIAPAAAVGAAVREALGQGYTHFDCAPLYNNQSAIGCAFAQLGTAERERIWVTSKLWPTNFAAEHVRPACLHTLGELQLE